MDETLPSPANPVPAVRRDQASPTPLHESAAVAGSFHVREVVAQSITPNDFPRLISLVRSVIPDAGTARELGDGLQWEHDSGYTSLSVTINPEPEGTVIRADLRTDGEQVAYYLGGGFVTILAACVGVTAHLETAGLIGLSAATLAVSTWAARAIWRRSNRRQAQDLAHAIQKIAAGLRGELD